MKKRVELKITGRVQGVFFRQGLKEEAEKLGIAGWTRNEPDGSVVVVAEDREEELQKLIKWCKKGTEYAKVDNVRVEWEKARGEFERFTIL